MLISLILLLLITLGGIDTVGGAFAAAMFYALSPTIQKHISIPEFTFILVGVGAVFVGRNPGGFAGQLFSANDRLRMLRDRLRIARTLPIDLALQEALELEPSMGGDRVAVR